MQLHQYEEVKATTETLTKPQSKKITIFAAKSNESAGLNA